MNNQSEQPAPLQRNLGRWFVALSQIVLLIMIVGGVVRLSGSGLSIPEWPVINGSLLPPHNDAQWLAVYKTYHRQVEGIEVDRLIESEEPDIVPVGRFKIMFAIEYFHRTVAAVLGLAFLWVALKVWSNAAARKRYGLRMFGLMALLLVQAMLGGLVVKTDLAAALVAIHLGVAYIFFGVLFWTGIEILYPPEAVSSGQGLFFARVALVVLGALYLQVVSGGMVAGLQAGHYLNTWPLVGEHLIPPLSALWSSGYQPEIVNLVRNKLLWQFFHRWWAFVAAAGSVWLVFSLIRFRVSGRCRLGLRALAALVMLQLALGVITLLLAVPAHLGVLHLTVAAVLFMLLVLINFELRNHAPETV